MSPTVEHAEYVKKLIELMRNLAANGWINGAEFSFWDRGGPPGTGFESNLLQFLGDEQTTRLVYTKTRFDPAAPPYRVEQYELSQSGIPPAVLGDILKQGLFKEAFEEEKPLPIAGVTKLTVTISDGSASLQKTFYRQPPKNLKGIFDQLHALLLRCETEGKRLPPHELSV